jgi:ferredoxin, 2Fe-2S
LNPLSLLVSSYPMSKVTYVLPNEKGIVVEANDGNLMSIAVDYGVPGIDGDCGGVGSCGTCHVCVDPDWVAVVGEATDVEKDLLEFHEGATPTSRLGCQVEITAELDGLVVRVVPRDN